MDRVLHRNSAIVLAGVFLFAFWGFWPSYFSHPLDQATWRFHFHGLTLISWCVLMVTQAYLIRTNRRSIHKQVGKLSYVLAPLVVIATLNLVHFRLQEVELTDFFLYALALPIGLLLQFSFAYGLAIYYRSSPVIHARYMICTAFVMIPPIFDRVMYYYLLPPERAQFLPQVGGEAMYPLVTYTVSDAILVFLSIWDRRTRKGPPVFPVVLAVFIGFQALTFTVYRMPFWKSFAEWFLQLPLS